MMATASINRSAPIYSAAVQVQWQRRSRHALTAATPARAQGSSGSAEFSGEGRGKAGSAAFVLPSAAAAAAAAGATPVVPAAAAWHGSGSAVFAQSGDGKTGTAAFSAPAETGAGASPPPPAAAAGAGAAAAAAAAVTSEPAPASQPAAAGGFWSLSRLQQQLKSLGVAGVVAYGILNTLYYSCAFLFFWIYVAKVPTGQGWAATARSFAAVMAAVWAGSQVTKVPRAAAALMMAPFVDRMMDALQRTLGLRTRNSVFLVFVAGCLSLAALLFAGVVVAWS